MTEPGAFLAAWGLAGAPPVLVARRENHVYRVETRDGPRALRLHRPGLRTRAELQSELDWMAVLAAGGLRVPAPCPTPDGVLCVEIGGVVGSMVHWIEGRPMGVDGQLAALADAPAAYHALGQAMARLHAISDAWETPPGFARPAWDADGLVGPDPLWGRYWENPLLTPAQAALLRDARDLARERLAAGAAGRDEGLIHADLVPENVILTESGPALIDFDDGGWGARVFDLATVANRALRAEAPGPLIAALVAGYTATRALDLGELGLFQALRAFSYVGWIAPRLAEPGAQGRAERFIALAERMARDLLQGKEEPHV
ncbi:MAG: phosphotransferase [Maritimibacter sp.]|nr:phosphotransferase [Maritimibacter sp.]